MLRLHGHHPGDQHDRRHERNHRADRLGRASENHRSDSCGGAEREPGML